MRNVAMVGSIILAALVLGGCPVPDPQTNPDLSAQGDPLPAVQDDSSQAAADTDQGASSPAATDAPAQDEPTADDPIETPNDSDDAPDPLPLTPGAYFGAITIVEDARCSGVYALAVGATVHNTTEWPNYEIFIGPDGLPDLADQSVDLGGMRVAYTYSDIQSTADSVTVNWLAQIEFVNPDTGAVYFTMPGTEVNVYRRNPDGSLQIDFLLSANVADSLGRVTYQVTMTGELAN